MKRWSGIAIGLGAYVIALIAMAPATLIDGSLRSASLGRMRLAEARGTLWSGSGQIEVRDAGARTGVAQSLTWRAMPLSLLRAHLVFEVGLERSEKTFPVTISFSRIALANADMSLPATALGLGIPKLAPLGLTGDVFIHVANLSIGRDAMNGIATLQWRAAGSNLTPVAPLGDYEVRLDGEGRTVHAYLRTIEGPLWFDGKGSWTQGANPDFLVTARISPEYQKQLAPLMRLIAVERQEGRFEVQLN
ncbi:MAG: type II secretion system protein N [Betaproteobacteria bacterium]|jgi:general secretion pathway protein N